MAVTASGKPAIFISCKRDHEASLALVRQNEVLGDGPEHVAGPHFDAAESSL